MDELKKCPFCGNDQITPVVIREIYQSYTCCQCHATGMVMNESATDDVVRRGWNNRPLEDALAAEIAVLHTQLDELDEIERVIMTRSEYSDGQLSYAEIVQDAFKRIETMADHYSQDLQTAISEIESEIAVLRDRLNAIHATAEELHLIIFGEAWTETDIDRIEYILEQADLTSKSPFSGQPTPEQQQLVDLFKEADNGNP